MLSLSSTPLETWYKVGIVKKSLKNNAPYEKTYAWLSDFFDTKINVLVSFFSELWEVPCARLSCSAALLTDLIRSSLHERHRAVSLALIHQALGSHGVADSPLTFFDSILNAHSVISLPY